MNVFVLETDTFDGGIWVNKHFRLWKKKSSSVKNLKFHCKGFSMGGIVVSNPALGPVSVGFLPSHSPKTYNISL